MNNDTPKTKAAIEATLESCGFIKGSVHEIFIDTCTELERENARLRTALENILRDYAERDKVLITARFALSASA